jgi:hypothetical protein
MNVVYHSVNAEPQKSSYSEFEVVDFFIKSDRNLVKNSLRLEGEIQMNSAGSTRLVFADNVGFNPRLGMHGLLKNVVVSIGGQVVENLQEGYAKYINLVESSGRTLDGVYNSDKLCELQCPNIHAAYALASGVKQDAGNSNFQDPDFSFKPNCCLNKMSDNLPLSRVGMVKVSVTLARNASFMMGDGVDADCNYSLKNLRLTYRTTEAADVPQVEMKTVSVIKQTLNNPFSNIDARVNSDVESVVVSFIRQSEENDLKKDSNRLAQPEGIEEVQFLINDSTNGYLQYVIDNPSDMVSRGLEAMRDGGSTNANYENIKASDGFLTGLKFPRVMNFSNNKLSMQVKSQVSNLIPYNVYMYFHNVVVV